MWKFRYFVFLLILVFAQAIPAQSISSIAENGYLLVDSKPFFPLGIYTEGIYDPPSFLNITDSVASSGLNTLWVESAAVDEMDFSTFFSYGQTRNLKHIIGLPRYSQFPLDFPYWVNFYKQFPSIIMWDILDDANNYPLQELITQRTRLDSLDTTRVTSQSMYSLGIVSQFAPYTEMPAMQGYPWGNGNDDLSQTYLTFSKFCDSVKTLGGVPMVDIQVFNWPGESYPSPEHLECQTYLSLVCGAKGIMYYTYLDYDANRPISNSQQPLWQKIKQNASEILSPTLQPFPRTGR
ncbi:MAG: hypothetical protein AAFV07_21165, partial [Bacteroidota bacterium]